MCTCICHVTAILGKGHHGWDRSQKGAAVAVGPGAQGPSGVTERGLGLSPASATARH